MTESEQEIFFEKEFIESIFEDRVSDLVIIGDNRIIVYESKLKLCLTNHLDRLGKKNSWINPFGIFSAIFITLITSEFEDVILSRQIWKSIFIVACVFSLLWFLSTLKYAFQSTTIDDIIDELKKDQKIVNEGINKLKKVKK